jgi:hypothetical protein
MPGGVAKGEGRGAKGEWRVASGESGWVKL